jgi:hypothetical protein
MDKTARRFAERIMTIVEPPYPERSKFKQAFEPPASQPQALRRKALVPLHNGVKGLSFCPKLGVREGAIQLVRFWTPSQNLLFSH